MFLKKEKDPASKQFDDDEWIRSLTEAQGVTTDVPEGSVVYDQQDVDPKKVRPIQTGDFLWEVRLEATLVTQRGRDCSPHDIDAADRSGYFRQRRGPGHLSATAL